MLGSHPIRIYSKTQSVVALSSAESEFYATAKAATEGIGVLSLMKDLGMTKKIIMEVDASAALGVIERKGIGKIRHLHTNAFWIQEQQIRDIIRFKKNPGHRQPLRHFHEERIQGGERATHPRLRMSIRRRQS